MQARSPFFGRLAISVWITLVFFLGLFIFPWRTMDWGTLKFANERTITVTGTAQTRAKNQIASFTAGVSATKDKKEDAVSEVNSKMDEVVKALKAFGVKAEDIKTQNNSIYQIQESYYDNGVQKTRPGQWSVNNNVEIVLREVDRASALSDLLAKSGANNVYGPNFMMDQTTSFEAGLLAEAMADAKTKAEAMAGSENGSLGEVINIVEGYSAPVPLYAYGGRGGGGAAAEVEPGSSTVSKTVTVTFSIK